MQILRDDARHSNFNNLRTAHIPRAPISATYASGCPDSDSYDRRAWPLPHREGGPRPSPRDDGRGPQTYEIRRLGSNERCSGVVVAKEPHPKDMQVFCEPYVSYVRVWPLLHPD